MLSEGADWRASPIVVVDEKVVLPDIAECGTMVLLQ